MKKLLCSYSNCQGSGIIHFLKKTRMTDEFDFVQHNNWQILMKEKPLDAMLEDAKRCDVFLYQPCQGYTCTDGTAVPGTGLISNAYAGASAKRISYSYQFNHGFFPMVKLGAGWDGWVSSEEMKQFAKHATDRQAHDHLIKAYFGEARIGYDCARRFVECMAEQARREQETDIKMVPWILQNYRSSRLFLTYNHPTTILFCQLALEVYSRVYGDNNAARMYNEFQMPKDENEANMNGVMPIHPAVVRELGLEYQPTDGSIEYYRDLLEQMIKEVR